MGSVYFLTTSAFRVLAVLSDDSIREASTGVSFPAHMKKSQKWVASGVRRKFGKIKVYAMAFYLEESSKLWGSSSVAMRDVLQEAPGRASLRIVITSSLVSTHKLSESLKESLRPRLLKKLSSKQADEVLDAFLKALMTGPVLKRGTALRFEFEKASVKIRMGEKYAAEVKSKALTSAFLEIYLDKHAVAPDFREAVFKGLAQS